MDCNLVTGSEGSRRSREKNIQIVFRFMKGMLNIFLSQEPILMGLAPARGPSSGAQPGGSASYSWNLVHVEIPQPVLQTSFLNGAPCLTQLDCTCDVPPPEMGQNLATCPQTIHESLSPSTMRDSQWWDKKPHILGLPKEI